MSTAVTSKGSESGKARPAARPAREWLIENATYEPDRELYWETIFALSNGYMAARGAFEENHACPEVRSYFGTYVAGIFDKYNKEYQAIVNQPDFFETTVAVNGEPFNMNRGRLEGFYRALDMKSGVLERRCVWTSAKGEKTELAVTRFISKAEPHLAVLHYKITPLNYSGEVAVKSALDGNVSNIDFHVSGYQLRDEKYFFIDDAHEAEPLSDGGWLLVRTKASQHAVCEAIRCELKADGSKVPYRPGGQARARRVEHDAVFKAESGKAYSFLKLIAVYSSKDGEADLKQACRRKLDEAQAKGYERLLEEHRRAWERAWETSNVVIEGDERDQRNVRFNIYHLIQMGNKDNPAVNIGSRGLTSEMHYGNCFWDTELFIMPFFIFTDPAAARALVMYRYLTLPAAREKAKRLWFKGAMYPWMSSFPGHEQADYWEYANIAVHIVSDVTYGLMNYYAASGDDVFMLDYGLEMLIETARFWESRVDYDSEKKKYAIITVKGPNEYDGVVNNNTYTNWNARWNLLQARKMVLWAKKHHARKLAKVAKKLGFNPAKETAAWERVARNMVINYDKKRDLYIEDDLFMVKRPVDIKKLKPGKVITTELGLTWDTLLRHRIVKQADVLLLMYLHRRDFTRRQVKRAWDFYEPITLHDSSLSYNTHCIFANELGDVKKSDAYFQQTARLDLEDVMANVFLGIHSANAGGTWQCVVNGFCGMRMDMERHAIEFHPNLPARWKRVEMRTMFRGNLFKVTVRKKAVKIAHEKALDGAKPVRVQGNKILAA